MGWSPSQTTPSRSSAQATAACSHDRTARSDPGLPRWARGPLRALPRAPLRRRTARLRRGHRAALRRDRRRRAGRRWRAAHPHNAVRLDLPLDEGDDQPVRRGLRTLLASGATTACSSHDERPVLLRVPHGLPPTRPGRLRQTTGVIGALELSPARAPAASSPTSSTTPKAKSDRLDLLRYAGPTSPRSGACPSPRASPTSAELPGPPLADLDRRRRRPPPALARSTSPASSTAIAAAVGAAAGRHRRRPPPLRDLARLPRRAPRSRRDGAGRAT